MSYFIFGESYNRRKGLPFKMGCQIGMIFNGKITLKFIENS